MTASTSAAREAATAVAASSTLSPNCRSVGFLCVGGGGVVAVCAAASSNAVSCMLRSRVSSWCVIRNSSSAAESSCATSRGPMLYRRLTPTPPPTMPPLTPPPRLPPPLPPRPLLPVRLPPPCPRAREDASLPTLLLLPFAPFELLGTSAAL